MKIKKIYKKLKKLYKKYGKDKILYVKLDKAINCENIQHIDKKLNKTNIKHGRGATEIVWKNVPSGIKEFVVRSAKEPLESCSILYVIINN